MKAKILAAQLDSNDCPIILDVRSCHEYRSGHIPGATYLPFWGTLIKRHSLPANKQQEIVLTCEHGPRAQLARVQLVLLGYTKVSLLEGHMKCWRMERLPLTR